MSSLAVGERRFFPGLGGDRRDRRGGDGRGAGHASSSGRRPGELARHFMKRVFQYLCVVRKEGGGLYSTCSLWTWPGALQRRPWRRPGVKSRLVSEAPSSLGRTYGRSRGSSFPLRCPKQVLRNTARSASMWPWSGSSPSSRVSSSWVAPLWCCDSECAAGFPEMCLASAAASGIRRCPENRSVHRLRAIHIAVAGSVSVRIDRSAARRVAWELPLASTGESPRPRCTR